MKSYKLSDLSRTEVDSLKSRPRIDFSSIFSVVSFDTAQLLAELSVENMFSVKWNQLLYHVNLLTDWKSIFIALLYT